MPDIGWRNVSIAEGISVDSHAATIALPEEVEGKLEQLQAHP